MKVFIHGYGSYPFHIDLAKELAKRGYKVYYIYTSACKDPNIRTVLKNEKNLEFIHINYKSIKKQSFLYRWFQESKYGSKVIHLFKNIKPDIIISSNTPLAAQRKLVAWANYNNIPFIFWLQDIISIAAKLILTQRLGFIGLLIGYYFKKIEQRSLVHSDHVIVITEDFTHIINELGVKTEKITFIPNWAPIYQIPLVDKTNDFSLLHKISRKFVVLYAGTLGMKHNPSLIAYVANVFKKDNDIVFVVVSDGFGMDFLKDAKKKRKLYNLILLPFQPFDILPQVLASANVFLTILEPSAGVFSVPSKVWSGFCAGRPTILVVPKDNLSARVTEGIGAGIVISENCKENLVKTINYIKSNPEECIRMGKNARKYAEQNFRINKIANHFEKVFKKVLKMKNTEDNLNY